MRSFFNMEGPLFVFLSKVADFMMLNIIFLICCIPIVTIGASLTAMSYVTMKMKDGAEGYIWKSFFKSFKENFKQSTVIWLIMLFLGIILGIDVLLLRQMSPDAGAFGHVMWYLIILGIVVWVCVFLYVFPLQARFYNPIRTTFRNALLVAAANAPKTLIMVLAIAASITLTFWTNFTFAWGLLVWMLGGFALLSYLNSTLQLGIIKKMTRTSPEENEEPADPDAWVVPDDPDAPAEGEDAAEREDAAEAEDASERGDAAEAENAPLTEQTP